MPFVCSAEARNAAVGAVVAREPNWAVPRSPGSEEDLRTVIRIPENSCPMTDGR